VERPVGRGTVADGAWRMTTFFSHPKVLLLYNAISERIIGLP
jgi:hypothetical protein